MMPDMQTDASTRTALSVKSSKRHKVTQEELQKSIAQVGEAVYSKTISSHNLASVTLFPFTKIRGSVM